MTEGRRTIVVLDIDTTIANNKHRAELIERSCIVCLSPVEYLAACPMCGSKETQVSQDSWDAFLDPDLMADDIPVPRAQETVDRMRAMGYEIFFLTGRRETTRQVTDDWLTRHFGKTPAETLYMRREDDYSLDAALYKERALRRLMDENDAHKASFLFFEDDPYVFAMYEKYGLVFRSPEVWEHLMPVAAKGSPPGIQQ